MNFKNIPLLIFIIVIVVFFSNCSNSYEKIVLEYFDLLKNEEYLKAFILLSERDRALLSLNDFSKEDEGFLSKKINKSIKCRIISSKLFATGKSAVVEVELKKINAAKLYTLIPELSDKSLSEGKIHWIFFKNWNLINNSYSKETIKYNLILENENWKINAGFSFKKRISDLFFEAEKSLADLDYYEALKAYKNILDFDNTNIGAINKIEVIEEKINYIKKSIEISVIDQKIEGNKIAISLRIKNSGTIVIRKIYVKLKFKNYDNSFFEYKDEILKNPSGIGYNQSKMLTILIDKIKDFKTIESKVYAIDF